jgi:hypothetical protein
MPTCARCGGTYDAEDGYCPTCTAACQRRKATRVVALGAILVVMLICALVLAYGIFSGTLYQLPA